MARLNLPAPPRLATTASLWGLLLAATSCGRAPEPEQGNWLGLPPEALSSRSQGRTPGWKPEPWNSTAPELACDDTCPKGACQPAVGCCPKGTAWNATTATCAPPGPVECVDTPAGAPCVPEWCHDWADEQGDPCVQSDAGCHPIGRACAPADGPDRRCPAGRVPDPGGEPGCLPAGTQVTLPAGHALVWKSDAPPTPAPPKVPALPLPLPPAGAPRWCPAGSDGAVGPCPGGEFGCQPGETPEVGGYGTCVPIGALSAKCPTGFVPTKKPGLAPGTLTPCIPNLTDCGLDTFGNVPAGEGSFFVDAGAIAEGDGSKAKPFATVAAALQAAKAWGKGASVVLGGGDHQGPVALDFPVILRGRCARLARIVAPAGKIGLVIGGAGVQAKVQDLAIVGGYRGVYVKSGAEATLSRVWIDRPEETGLRVTGGATLKATAVLIEGAALQKLKAGRGARIDGAAKVTLEQVRVQGARDRGLYISGPGTVVTAKGLLIDGTGGRDADDRYGYGLYASDGAQLVLTDGRLHGNHTAGIMLDAVAKGTRLERVLVEATESQPSDGSHGEGIVVRGGAQVELRGARVIDNRTTGITVQEKGTTLTTTNLMVAKTRARLSDGLRGGGVRVSGGARLDLAWAWLKENRRVGVAISGGMLDVRHALVAETLAEGGTKWGGRGISIGGGAVVTLDEVRASGNRDVGLDIGGKGTTVMAKKLTVDRTFARESDGNYGRGVVVDEGASLSITGGRIYANRDIGLLVSGPGSELFAGNLVLDGTLPRKADGRYGRGLQAEAGATVNLVDAHLALNRNAGVHVSGAGTLAKLSDCLVARTLASAPDRPQGYGVAALGGARLLLANVDLYGNAVAGLYGSDQGTEILAADLIVHGTLSAGGGEGGGHGVSVDDGARLELRRARLSSNRDVGLFAEGTATVVDAWDLLVDQTAAVPVSGLGGRGVEIERGAVGWMRRVWLLGNRDVALFADGKTTEVNVADLRIERTVSRQGGGGFGRHVEADRGATVRIAGARMNGHAGGAIVADYKSTLQLDGLLLAAGDKPLPTAVVAGIGLMRGSTGVVRGSRIDKPWRLGVAVSRSTLRMSECVIEGTRWPGGALPEVGEEAEAVADAVGAYKADIEIDRSLLSDPARAGLIQVYATACLLRGSRVEGGRYGLVTQSGLQPALTGSLVLGQSVYVEPFETTLTVPLDMDPARPRPGIGSP